MANLPLESTPSKGRAELRGLRLPPRYPGEFLPSFLDLTLSPVPQTISPGEKLRLSWGSVGYSHYFVYDYSTDKVKNFRSETVWDVMVRIDYRYEGENPASLNGEAKLKLIANRGDPLDPLLEEVTSLSFSGPNYRSVLVGGSFHNFSGREYWVEIENVSNLVLTVRKGIFSFESL